MQLHTRLTKFLLTVACFVLTFYMLTYSVWWRFLKWNNIVVCAFPYLPIPFSPMLFVVVGLLGKCCTYLCRVLNDNISNNIIKLLWIDNSVITYTHTYLLSSHATSHKSDWILTDCCLLCLTFLYAYVFSLMKVPEVERHCCLCVRILAYPFVSHACCCWFTWKVFDVFVSCLKRQYA